MSDRTRRGPSTGVQAPAPTTAKAAPTVTGSNAQAQEGLAYTNAFGSRAGGFLYGLVEDNLSAEALGGHASNFVTGQMGSMGDRILSEADPANVSEYLDALRIQRMMRPSGDAALSFGDAAANSGLVTGAADWAQENPWGVAGLGALGLAGFVASDQDLAYDRDFDLGKSGFSLAAGADLGSTLDLGFDAARLGLSYQGDGSSAFLRGEQRFDRDAWSLNAGYNRELQGGSQLAFSLGHSHDVDTDVTSAGVRWNNADMAAYLNGTYTQGPDGDVGRIAAGIGSTHDGPLQWTVDGWADTNDQYQLGAGLSYVPENESNFAAYVRANASRNAQGETDAGVFAGVGWNF